MEQAEHESGLSSFPPLSLPLFLFFYYIKQPQYRSRAAMIPFRKRLVRPPPEQQPRVLIPRTWEVALIHTTTTTTIKISKIKRPFENDGSR